MTTNKEEESKSGESSSAKFTQLRDELLHEASQTVVENPGHKIAILISDPPSSSSEPRGISLYTFGPPSDECLVKKYLDDVQRSVPESVVEKEKDPTSFWWEDGKILDSNDPVKLKAAMDEIMELKNSLIELRDYKREEEEDQSAVKPQG